MTQLILGMDSLCLVKRAGLMDLLFIQVGIDHGSEEKGSKIWEQ